MIEKDNILGFPLYRFYYDEKKVQGVLNSLLKLSWVPNTTNWMWDGVTEDGTGSTLHELPEFSDIFEWMQKCFDEIAEDMGMTCDLKINSSWSHLSQKGNSFFEHAHGNAFVSSTYYASGSSEDKTVWLLPNPYFHGSNIFPCGPTYPGKDHKYFLTHEEPTEPGKFVVFPSTVSHYAQENTSDADRVTISCDAFPTGLINQGYTSRLRVQVQQESMTTKFFYIVEHYVPFPQSEYGGLWNVIAENDEECFDLITNRDDGNFNERYYGDLRENIMNSRTYALSEDLDSGVVEEFTT